MRATMEESLKMKKKKLIQKEQKDGIVRGFSFHKEKPLILISFGNSVMKLFDCKTGYLKFTWNLEEDDINDVDFHASLPMFVSGGTAGVAKIWNYESYNLDSKIDFTHFSPIRSVQFHLEKTLIISASADNRIAICDWESKKCLAVLLGHEGSVNTAYFHPSRELVVSASSDSSVRIWDYSEITEDYSGDTISLEPEITLQNHAYGVVCASFHPTMSLIMSGSNNGQIQVLELAENEVALVRTLSRKFGSISCMFHPSQDLIVSSNDTEVHVWDRTTGALLQTFVDDRFSKLALHPKLNLLATSNDLGLVIFRLDRERPAFSLSGDSVFSVKDRRLQSYEFPTQICTSLFPILSPVTASIDQSPTENAVLICSDLAGGSYELHIIGNGNFVPMAGLGGPAVFFRPDRFAVFVKADNLVMIKDLQNELVDTVDLPFLFTTTIFSAGIGNLLCRYEDKVVIFDVEQRLVVSELKTPSVRSARHVYWSTDMEKVALLSKNAIVVASKELVPQYIIEERICLKSGTWDDSVFIYSTLKQVKYCLPDGDTGVLCTLDDPIYITKVSGNRIFYLDRQGNNRDRTVNATEYIFKLALLRKDYDKVLTMMGDIQLLGQSVSTILHQKAFNVVLEMGNLSVAGSLAEKIDDESAWHRFGVEALRQGYVGTAVKVYERIKNFHGLSFLHLITGNVEKLSQFMDIDTTDQFHHAFYLGDVEKRVKILENCGRLPLAYIMASTHGLHETAKRLAIKLGDNIPLVPEGITPSLLMPPTPVMRGGDWPLKPGAVDFNLEHDFAGIQMI